MCSFRQSMEEEKRGNAMQSILNCHIVWHEVGLNFEACSHERQGA